MNILSKRKMLSGALIAGMALGCTSNAKADLSVNEKAFQRFLYRGLVSMVASAAVCFNQVKSENLVTIQDFYALVTIPVFYTVFSSLDIETMLDSCSQRDDLKEAYKVHERTWYYAYNTALMAGIAGLGGYVANTVLQAL